MSGLSLMPRCTPLPPEPTLLDGWRAAPGWFVVVACTALLFGGLMWRDVRRMRRPGDRGILARWSVALSALGYSSAIAFAVVVFGLYLPLSDAQSAWVDHSLAVAGNCLSALNLVEVIMVRQEQQGSGLIALGFVLLLLGQWSIFLSRRFIRRAHFAKMERGLERS